jgi:hypothetical protein
MTRNIGYSISDVLEAMVGANTFVSEISWYSGKAANLCIVTARFESWPDCSATCFLLVHSEDVVYIAN